MVSQRLIINTVDAIARQRAPRGLRMVIERSLRMRKGQGISLPTRGAFCYKFACSLSGQPGTGVPGDVQARKKPVRVVGQFLTWPIELGSSQARQGFY
ncbi:MAG TPA: hypothetical protein VGG64_26005 [Pirellulales bacterium]